MCENVLSDEMAGRLIDDIPAIDRDRAIFWSSAFGNRSFRLKNQESFFVKHLCDIFAQFGKKESLDEMVKRVIQQMSEEPAIAIPSSNQK